MRFVWRTETMILPDHKVAITKQFKDCEALIQSYYQGSNYVLQSKDSHCLQKNTKLEFTESQFNSP